MGIGKTLAVVRAILARGVGAIRATSITVPGAGVRSEAHGLDATAAGQDATAYGNDANAGGTNSTAIGRSSQANSSSGTAVGRSTLISSQGTAVGQLAVSTGVSSCAYGDQASATLLQSQAYGELATTNAANQWVTGSVLSPIVDMRLGVNANGASLSVRSATELLATTSGATVTTSGLIPAGAVVKSVTIRVETAVTTSGATDTFDVGDSGDADRYGAAIAGADNTATDETDYTADPAGVWSASGREIILDAAGAETFTAGDVRVTVHYEVPNPNTTD